MVSAGVLCCSFSGCGSGSSTGTPPPPPPPPPPVTGFPGVSFTGKAMAGKQAIVGAAIQLYAAGTTGQRFGCHGTPHRLRSPRMRTAAFTVPASYSCPAGTSQLYVVAQRRSGGNLCREFSHHAWPPRSGRAIKLRLTSQFVINEVTTAATVWGLHQFLASGVNVRSLRDQHPGPCQCVRYSSESGEPHQRQFAGSGLSCKRRLSRCEDQHPREPAQLPARPLPRLHPAVNSLPRPRPVEAPLQQYARRGAEPGTKSRQQCRSAVHASDLSSAFAPALTAAPADWTLFSALPAAAWTRRPVSVSTRLATSGSPAMAAAQQAARPSALYLSSRRRVRLSFRTASLAMACRSPMASPSMRRTMSGSPTKKVPPPSITAWEACRSSTPAASLSPALRATSPVVWISPSPLPSTPTPTPGSSTTATRTSPCFRAQASLSPALRDTPPSPSPSRSRSRSTATITRWIGDENDTTSPEVSSDGTQFSKSPVAMVQMDSQSISSATSGSANLFGDSVSEVSGTGAVVSSGYSDNKASIDHPQGIAIDGSGHVWVANFRGPAITELAGSATSSPGSDPIPYGRLCTRREAARGLRHCHRRQRQPLGHELRR